MFSIFAGLKCHSNGRDNDDVFSTIMIAPGTLMLLHHKLIMFPLGTYDQSTFTLIHHN